MSRLTYEQAVQTLYGLQRFGMKLGLEKIRALLGRLGNPQGKFLSCHIAGTNGKGTCAAVLDAVLRAHDVPGGLYTSPHLISIEERIRSGGQFLPGEYISSWVNEHIGYINRYSPTFFEAVTAMAFDYFRDSRIRAAAVEAGMGGRFDATNVIEPGLCVITSIGLEHTQYLGRSLSQIAGEKAGIAKPKVPLLCGERRASVIEVIQSVAGEVGTSVRMLDTEISFKRAGGKDRELIFNYRGPGLKMEGAKVALYGSHQLRNVALGIWAAELMLDELNCKAREEVVRNALENLYWPGRFQLLRQESGTELVLDVAHNPPSAEKLAQVFQSVYGQTKAVGLVAMAQDKDLRKILRHLLKIIDIFIFPQIDFGRMDRQAGSASPGKLGEIIKEESPEKEVVITSGMKEALELALKISERRPLLVTGSFHTVGEAMIILGIKVL